MYLPPTKKKKRKQKNKLNKNIQNKCSKKSIFRNLF